MSLRQLALNALLVDSPDAKCAAVQSIVRSGEPPTGAAHEVRQPIPAALPGRPARPLLVPPAQLAQRPVNTLEGRAALIHALAHIELNAVNLALDIVWRFDGMPADFYRDWIGVAFHGELLQLQERQIHAAGSSGARG